MNSITSVDNPLIKQLAQLDSAKERYKQQRFVAEGMRICSTLIDAQQTLEQLFVTEDKLTTAQELCADENITVVTPHVLNKISHSTTPSGIVGIFKLPTPKFPLVLESGIVLDQINDPGNMGTLIRTCSAFGKKTVVVLEGSVDPWSPKVVQATAGTIGYVQIVKTTVPELIKHTTSLSLIGLVVQGGKKPQEINSKKETLLVIGSEAHGISQTLLQQCDQLLTLPMPGETESLNAAIAGSIAMYELWIK